MTRLITLILSLSLAPTLVFGSESSFYVGATFGYGTTDSTADTENGLELSFDLFIPEILVAGIDGLVFEDSEPVWNGLVGYRINDYVSLEVAYSELGTFESSPISPVTFGSPGSLDVSEFTFGSKFRFPITEKLSANWYVGISRARFDAGGIAQVLVSFGGLPPEGLTTLSAPYSGPSDETGYVWGFGGDWQVSSRFAVDLGFRRHETQVIPVDTLNLGLLFSF